MTIIEKNNKSIAIEEEVKRFEKNILDVKKEFEALVEKKELGKALKVALRFTDEIEEFHEILASTDSDFEMFLVLNKVKFPLENWRDFLEEYTYFDDEKLMKKWINIEKKYFKRKREFEANQRTIFVELSTLENIITIYAYFNDFNNADKKWINAKEFLSRIIDDDVVEHWNKFELEYLKWKENFNLGKKVYYIKISEDLRKIIEELTNESLELLNQAKLAKSFEKQTKIVELIESFFK